MIPQKEIDDYRHGLRRLSRTKLIDIVVELTAQLSKLLTAKKNGGTNDKCPDTKHKKRSRLIVTTD